MTTHNRTRRYFAYATVVLILLFMLNITIGSVNIPLKAIWHILCGSTDEKATWQYIILQSRIPAAITALLCGASLAVSGLMLQTSFNNPLAGPSIFGISSGASLGVAIVMLLFNGSLSTDILTLNGFIAVISGALCGSATVIIILLLLSKKIRNNVALLIVGIMVGYLSSAAISIMNFFASEQGISSYVMWGMGSFNNVSIEHLPAFTTATTLCIALSLLLVKPLNALLLGDRYAANLGINAQRTRTLLLLLTGIQTAVTTAYCGPVAFIGLAVPHIARLLLHTDSQSSLMPCTIITGGLVALLCNLLSTTPATGSIIPLNAITPIIGAPVIIYIVVKQRSTER